MTIGNVSFSSQYTGQTSLFNRQSTTMGRSGPNGGGHPPDPSEMFNKVDKDGSGGLDQTEFVTLSNKISEVTGEEIDAEEIFAAYDEDGDGVLNEDETQAVMEAYKPEGPPPGGGMGGPGGPGGPPPELSELVAEMDEDEDGVLSEDEATTLAEMISNATGEEIDVEDLFAAYDEDGDGVLSEEESLTALEENRPEGPPPPPEGRREGGQGSSAAVASAIETYLQMASMGSGQEQGSTLLTALSDQSNSLASGLFSVNTRV